MAVARNGTVKIYWESTGQGPAVLLIAGQGMTVDGWWATIPVLSRSFRVIAFDNRDTGRSGRVPWAYSVPQMAGDAMAVVFDGQVGVVNFGGRGSAARTDQKSRRAYNEVSAGIEGRRL